MRGLRRTDGALAPLFDRLTDDTPGVSSEPVPRRVLDLEKLAASVEHEIRTVLNTRCPLGENEVDYSFRTVVDYGLVDISHYYTDNPQDRKRLAMHVAKTIAAYEPRLLKVNVVVEAVRRNTGTLDLRIEGGLRFRGVVEPVSFPIRIDAGVGSEDG